MGPRELSYAPAHRPADKLRGYVTVVTGAASGIGAETARVFAAEGARVVATDLHDEGLQSLRHGLGNAVTTVVGDLTEPDTRSRVLQAALDVDAGRLDVLVNSAGVTVRGSLEDATPDNFALAIDINLGAVLQMMRVVAPAMRLARRGSIVNFASITSLQGLAGAVSYTASKAGLTGMTRAVAVELAPANVRVNAVCPGVVDSPMTRDYWDKSATAEADYAALRQRQPMNRLASPRDCALAALFLASADSSFITGVALPVDGGRHAT